MLKVLIICPEINFPPNDGISKAIESIYIKLVMFNVEVNCVSILEPNVFYSFDFENQQIYKVAESHFESFDVYIASPLIPAWRMRKVIPANKIKLALLSDCYTFVLWRSIMMSIKFGYFSLKEILYMFKLPLIYFSELIISRNYDYLLFQTEKDVKIASKLLFSSQCKKSTNLLNLSQSKYQTASYREGIGWVASFDGDYIFIAKYFFKNVMVQILEKSASTNIYILGKKNTLFVSQLKRMYPHLEQQIHEEKYYSDLSKFYLKRNICVAPIYKGYGLINKTMESLYYGCITIGDESAFNGISGFIHAKHGYVAKNNSEFIRWIIENIETNNIRMRGNSKTLIKALNKDWLINDFARLCIEKSRKDIVKQ